MKTVNRNLMLSAVLAALTAVLAQLAVPIGPVPISLATLGTFLSGGLLGKRYGAVSQVLYVLLGAVGVPVFSAFTGGLGVVAGPRGGFLAGYIAGAFLTGWLAELGGRRILPLAGGMAAGCAVIYLLGTSWYMLTTGSALLPAVTACVLPFLPGDLLKIAAGVLLVRRLTPILQHSLPRIQPGQ